MPRRERFTLEDPESPELRLVIEGYPDEEPSVSIEIELDEDWIARHDIERQNGVWMVSEAKDYRPSSDVSQPLTARLKRKATVHQHLPRIERLLDEALDLDRRLDLDPATKLDHETIKPWWDILAYEWRISRLRSRRGRAPKINPREVEQLVDQGLTYRQIGERLGVHRKSVDRAMRRDRKRNL